MGSNIILGYDAHRDSHPALYEGNHRDYYFSLLPVSVPLPLFTIPNTYPWRNPILGSEVL